MLTECVDKTNILESWQFIEPANKWDFQAKKAIDVFGMNSGISITQNSDKNWIAYLPDEHIDKTVSLVVNKPNDLPAKLTPLTGNVPGIETTKDIENVALSKPIVELPQTVLSDLNLKQYKLLKRDEAKYFFKVKQDLLIVDLKQNNYQIKLLHDGKIITKKNFENYHDLIKYLQLHNFSSVNE